MYVRILNYFMLIKLKDPTWELGLRSLDHCLEGLDSRHSEVVCVGFWLRLFELFGQLDHPSPESEFPKLDLTWRSH